VRAERGGRDTPSLRAAEPDATLERAYAVQRAFVGARFGGGLIGGYKTGLSTPSAQSRFGVSEPIAGVLPGMGRLEGEPRIDPSRFRRLLVEIEFAFELASDVNRALEDEAAMRAVVSGIRPAVELPDLGFPSIEGLHAVDLVAANVAASYVLVGTPVAPGDVELDTLSASLARDGKVIIGYHAEQSELEPWEAVRWLVNDRLARGWPLRRGQILLAGSLGPPGEGMPGHYAADFGALGSLRFEIASAD
jgi:2-keto-4-pentenoate hydratase